MALVILDVKQVDVAEELNVTKGYIGKMLSGERNSKDCDRRSRVDWKLHGRNG